MVKNNYIQRGSVRSCGCLDRERRRLPLNRAAENTALRVIKYNAKKSGRIWAITDEEARALINQPCHWCGRERVGYRFRFFDYNGNPGFNGIDRIDNARGYEPGNVWSACGDCNVMRSDMTPEQFADMCHRISTHQRLEQPREEPADLTGAAADAAE